MTWIDQVFLSGQASSGGVVRRSKSSVDHYSSKQILLDEVARRGYHLLEYQDQYLIFCDPEGKFRVLA